MLYTVRFFLFKMSFIS